MKLPTYKALLETLEDGITTISWVTNPATQIDMLCFSEEKDSKKYRFADEEKQMVSSVVMLADTKIYRNDFGYEYYVTYDKDTLIKMCEKMLSENTYKNISFEHNGEIIEEGKITLVELYTTDENKKSPFNVPEGSIIATYHVNDMSLWELFKSGELGGISLEGYFTIKEIKDNFSINKKSMFNKIKEALKAILTNSNTVTAEDGTLLYYSTDTIELNSEVVDENGLHISGVFKINDKEVTIEDSIVTQIVDIEIGKEDQPTEEVFNEDEPTEEVIEEEETTEEIVEDNSAEITSQIEAINARLNAVDERINQFENQLQEFATQIETIKKSIESILEKINAPMADPIPEEFENIVEDNKWSKLGSALRK